MCASSSSISQGLATCSRRSQDAEGEKLTTVESLRRVHAVVAEPWTPWLSNVDINYQYQSIVVTAQNSLICNLALFLMCI